VSIRCEEEGYEAIARPDGRRGLWVRLEGEFRAPLRIEICAGREGGDCYLDLKEGEVLTKEKLGQLYDALSRLRYAGELAKEQNRDK
jgi:hypothetical protein